MRHDTEVLDLLDSRESLARNSIIVYVLQDIAFKKYLTSA